MATSSGLPDGTLSPLKGGEAIRGSGETFQPDLHTGTCNFAIPIEIPVGRNGLRRPELVVQYQSQAPG